jgi:hypothetical protein
MNTRAGGSALLALAGVVGMLLGILGLAGIMPGALDGLTLIVLGGALGLGSWLFRTPKRPLPGIAFSGRRVAMGSFSKEVVLGLAALLLGILALTRRSTLNLVALGVIALGIALWSGSEAEDRKMDLAGPLSRAGDRRASPGIIGLVGVVGIGAVILGILALFGSSPRILNLIALVGVGCAVFLAGTIMARGLPRRTA